ncbi:MAG: pyrroline-5-carboxylate reductase [Thermoprotei archaeon]|nr:MAG: pyrroline-5-carboxylate reductase [Thermoprotei archaeon]
MKVGVIGAGKIGEALISGLIKAGYAKPEDLIASDINDERRRHIASAYGVRCTKDNVEVARSSEVIILSVKPKDVASVLEEIKEALTPSHLLISVAAGVATSYIARVLGKPIPIVRAMPNVAVLVREGMTAITAGPNANERHLKVAEELFSAVGKTVRLREEYFDAVTALSGSGPAYMFLIIEAMTDAGVRVGLPRDMASLLSSQTALGAAKLLLETGEHPAKLREMVTTPAGVTIEGLIELERGGIRTTIIEAVTRATRRSKELLAS